MRASPRVARWNCLCRSRTFTSATSPHNDQRTVPMDVVVPDPPLGVIIWSRVSQSKALAVCPLFSCSAVQHQPQRKPAARCCRPPCEHPNSRLRQVFRIAPSAPFLRPRRHIVRPFPALLRFPLTHDLVEWSGGSKINLHFIRLNYLRRCWVDASCLPYGTSPTLTAPHLLAVPTRRPSVRSAAARSLMPAHTPGAASRPHSIYASGLA